MQKNWNWFQTIKMIESIHGININIYIYIYCNKKKYVYSIKIIDKWTATIIGLCRYLLLLKAISDDEKRSPVVDDAEINRAPKLLRIYLFIKTESKIGIRNTVCGFSQFLLSDQQLLCWRSPTWSAFVLLQNDTRNCNV